MNHPLLTQGSHLFTSPTKNLTFEYLVLHPTNNHNNNNVSLPLNLITIQCPAWGIGSRYLQTGLYPLTTQPQTHNNILLFFHPRGTDRSSRPAHASQMCSMPHLASDLDDLRQHLGLRAFPVLLGHSNGGAIALGYAEMYPERVQKLVLLNHQLVGMKDRGDIEVFRGDERYAGAFWRMMECRREEETDGEFTRSVREMWPLYFWDPGRFVSVLVRDIGEGRVMPVWCYRGLYGCDQGLSRSGQMIDGLEKVCARTLMIFGRDDLICGLKIAERSREGIKGARLIAYDHCGHFPWIEQRERTLDDIAAFLDN